MMSMYACYTLYPRMLIFDYIIMWNVI